MTMMMLMLVLMTLLWSSLQIREILDGFHVWKEYKDQKHDLFLNDRPVSGYLTGLSQSHIQGGLKTEATFSLLTSLDVK